MLASSARSSTATDFNRLDEYRQTSGIVITHAGQHSSDSKTSVFLTMALGRAHKLSIDTKTNASVLEGVQE